MSHRLADQAERQLKKGGKFEDLSAGACRPTALIGQYAELCTQVRIDALDDLDQLATLEQLKDSADLKNKILFSVVVVRAPHVARYKSFEIYTNVGPILHHITNIGPI